MMIEKRCDNCVYYEPEDNELKGFCYYDEDHPLPVYIDENCPKYKWVAEEE